MQRLAHSRPPVDSEWAESAAGQRVLNQTLRQAKSPTTSRRSMRKPLTIAACLLGMSAIAGTAAATLTGREANRPDEVGCYEALDPQANTTVLGQSSLDKVGGDFVTACRSIWPEVITPGTPAPANLVTCVNTAGGRGVYPAPEGLSERDACARIDALPETPPTGP